MEMLQKETVALWICAFRAGDDSAFVRLLEAYSPMLYRTISDFGLSTDDGEAYSVASEAFHAAALHWRTDGSAAFGTYAKRAVENALKRLLHARREESSHLGGDVDALSIPPMAEKHLLRRENTERMLRMVREVASEEEYRVFLSLIFRGESVAEYMASTGKSRKQVENTKARLLMKLKRYPELYRQLTT